ncbi:hypothetical protein CsSME_00054230 [Camellia sinensis var. sinensis]
MESYLCSTPRLSHMFLLLYLTEGCILTLATLWGATRRSLAPQTGRGEAQYARRNLGVEARAFFRGARRGLHGLYLFFYTNC